MKKINWKVINLLTVFGVYLIAKKDLDKTYDQYFPPQAPSG